MGSGYVVENCISAFMAKQERKSFEYYIADVGAAIITMFSKEKFPTYYSLLHPEEAEEEKTGEEIAADVIARLGLKVVG